MAIHSSKSFEMPLLLSAFSNVLPQVICGQPTGRECDQDLRQGRACPGAHPRPPGFRRQNLDAHPPGPSKKTKRTPTRPLGKCLSNTPTHPAQRKKAKNGPGRPVPAWKKPRRPIPVGLEPRPLDQKPLKLPLNHYHMRSRENLVYKFRCPCNARFRGRSIHSLRKCNDMMIYSTVVSFLA